MNRIVAFLTILYLILFAGGWWLLSGNLHTLSVTKDSLTASESLRIEKESEIATLRAENETLKKKIADSRTSVAFLALALCPVLETSKDALCIKNGTEWLTKTIESGTSLSDPLAKEEMAKLLVSFSGKKQPSAKQFYELLKPVEIRALSSLAETLK